MRLVCSAIAVSLALGACGDGPDETVLPDAPKHNRDAAWTPEGGLPPFAERQDPNPGRGSWMNRLDPQPSEACQFTEKPASERPEGLTLTAWSGNLDLYTPPDTLAHDHAIGFIESTFMNDGPVVAVRMDMDDLWIEPVGENVVLFIGADELTCRRASGES